MKLTTYLLLCLAMLLFMWLASCKPCDRIARLNTKHGYCIDTTTRVRIDTLPGDTLRFHFHTIERTLDTVWHTKEGVRVHVVRSHDTLMIQGTCPPCDTIHHYTDKVRIHKVIEQRTPWWNWLVIAGAFILCILVLLGNLTRR